MGALLLRRLKTSTGAPLLSGPKLGNACANLPSSIAASASSSADVTAPCPPLPCQRTSIVFSISFNLLDSFKAPLEGLEPSHPAPEAGALSPELQGLPLILYIIAQFGKLIMSVNSTIIR